MSTHATDAQKSDWHRRSDNPDCGSWPAMTEAEKNDWHPTENTLTAQEMRPHQPKGGWVSDMPSTLPWENPDYGSRPAMTEARTEAEHNYWQQTDNTQTSQEMRAVEPKGDWLSDMPSTLPSENRDYGSRPATTDAEKSYWHQTDNLADNTLTGQEMRAVEPKGDWLSAVPATRPSENLHFGSRPLR